MLVLLSSSGLVQRLRDTRPGRPAGRAIRDRSLDLHEASFAGRRVRHHAPEQRPGQHRCGEHGRGAEGGDELQRLCECLAGRVDQLPAEGFGELVARRYGAAERVTRGVGRLVRDIRRDRVGHLAAVDGGADHAEDGDAERFVTPYTRGPARERFAADVLERFGLPDRVD
jgi:hypothetical protein